MIEIKAFKEKLKNQSGRFPVLTLEDFFVNNTNEDASLRINGDLVAHI